MPLDAITIAAVADELRGTCLGGRIQAVFLPAPLSLGLEIYSQRGTHYLFASAHAQHARVHLTEGKLSRGSEDVTPLLLLLRKYVRDGRLAGVEQPALERTLALIITKADVFDKGRSDDGHKDREYGDEERGEAGRPQPGPIVLTTTRIIIEIMGRYSNIVLVDEAGDVMEAVKHISSEVNRYRVTLPRHTYQTPPPQAKADPRGVSAASLAATLATAPGQPAWQTLVKAYTGISPLLARETVFRATGITGAPGSAVAPPALASALIHLLSLPYNHQWSPTIAREGDSIIEFAPYEPTHLGTRTRPVATISEAMHEFYAQETVATDYAGLKQDVGQALATQRQRLLRRQASLLGQQAMASEADALRTQGEMVLAYAAGVKPGQVELVADMGESQPALHIALDPRLTAVENAQAYFKRYARARDAARSLPALLNQLNLDLAFLEQLDVDLALAETSADIRAVKEELAQWNSPGPSDEEKPAGKKPPRRKQQSTAQGPRPLSVLSPDGMTILIGRNARQNDALTFELSSPLDIWLHARGVPGSHVIIRSGGHPISPDTLRQAASLAAAYSSAGTSASVPVAYTQRRNVRRVKGAGPGMVSSTGEQTIQVRPAPLLPRVPIDSLISPLCGQERLNGEHALRDKDRQGDNDEHAGPLVGGDGVTAVSQGSLKQS